MGKTLKNPPKNGDKELWLQNVAGVLIFENIRTYALNKIPENIPSENKKEIVKGIDNAVYGLMMMMDGGLNIVGIITDTKFKNEKSVNCFFGNEYKILKKIKGENALSTKFEDNIDVFSNNKGSLILLDIKHCELFIEKGIYIQFIIGDTSGTYCYSQYLNGELERNLILSEGETFEDKGKGIIDENDDFQEIIFGQIENILGIKDVFELDFTRYK